MLPFYGLSMGRIEIEKNPLLVRAMFGRIALRYDRLNRMMTLGQDLRWRKEVVQRAAIPSSGRVLDLGTGTGDLALEVVRYTPAVQVVAADFALPMMQVGRRGKPAIIRWCAADALSLPFPSESFDAVVSGFLLRNVADLERSLSEQYRVLRTGGKWVSLDTTPPRPNLLLPFIMFHLNFVIPALGRWIAGDGAAYHYLPQTTQSFLSAEELAELLRKVGFCQVGFCRRMFGTVAIHWGRKG
ncbi:MAG: ubiquinone/menaquinone biosynthesis methyltransferase [Anaerolineales bacterium]|nr:ubiquinone/menaquinone biosynthesis methyltransferase [Anaerolineales bacterium]MCS7248988.1 ubiquinone/menaquinone biosynthesis methyltransferase [Anaerolineales bacterium]MDW8162801.1 ubiquinone/menaquinone biosynthesis methyltransferase [Anaerolineales bacterium]MDW8447657.1 ubiquinone/menaquinone biosynthesis methyltransferase [Anaerolineales bacterium]